jgi:hypothetical protein
MITAPLKQLTPPYLRQQAHRCQRLSRDCMDMTTARDLRLMAEEYFAEALEIEVATPTGRGIPIN